ncbi:MAG TPA: glycine betaine ABC transporter substrate-binding protein [Candidatus Methanoperedens sp.]|nr:glycine betaine ABC transporter substrate-binding protein [Candidatus Methanoperedens sp.]
MKKVLTVAIAVIVVAAACLASWWPVEACVGKTIFLGRLPGREQEVLAEMFSWMVSERTGTTIQTKSFPDSRATHAALQTADIDLYLEDQGVALREILGHAGAGAPEARDTVRREYEQRFNLVWLEPWGMTGHAAGAAAPTLVAPVIRKDTLKKFPALSRLVNKLAGVVDDATLAKLVRESEQRPAREVVKQFLKDKRLI